MKNHLLEGKIIGIPMSEHLFLTGLVTRQNKDILLGYFLDRPIETYLLLQSGNRQKSA